MLLQLSIYRAMRPCQAIHACKPHDDRSDGHARRRTWRRRSASAVVCPSSAKSLARQSCIPSGDVANPCRSNVIAWQRQIAARQVEHHRASSRSLSRRFRAGDRYITTIAWRRLLLISWMFESPGKFYASPQMAEVSCENCHGKSSMKHEDGSRAYTARRPGSGRLSERAQFQVNLATQWPSGSTSAHPQSAEACLLV
jgi:hypothetical protein